MVSNFPEKAKLDEICKFCNFPIPPMTLSAEGVLEAEVVKATPAPKRKYR